MSSRRTRTSRKSKTRKMRGGYDMQEDAKRISKLKSKHSRRNVSVKRYK